MMDSTTLRKWLLALLVLASTTAHAASSTSNLEREKYWADQVVDAVLVGEAVWLQNRGHKFLALYAAPEKPAHTAVILIHGRGVHPAWGFIDKLYRDLHESGYHTLSLQMPILSNEAKFSAYGATFPEAYERIDAGIRYLKSQAPQVRQIVLVGHSSGAMTVVAYAAKHPGAGLSGVAAIGLSSLNGGPEVMQPPLMLRSIRLPVLDIYGGNDLAEVLQSVGDRQRAAQEAGNRRYRAVRVQGADHFFSEQYPELLRHLREWLAPLSGTPAPARP